MPEVGSEFQRECTRRGTPGPHLTLTKSSEKAWNKQTNTEGGRIGHPWKREMHLRTHRQIGGCGGLRPCSHQHRLLPPKTLSHKKKGKEATPPIRLRSAMSRSQHARTHRHLNASPRRSDRGAAQVASSERRDANGNSDEACNRTTSETTKTTHDNTARQGRGASP